MLRRKLFSSGLLGLAAPALSGCVEDQRRPVLVSGPGCDTTFRVVNNSSRVVERLFFSHSSQGAWGADQLGNAVLPPGRFVNYRAANPGAYDFRIVWNNGRAAEIRRVNVCRATQITVTDRGLFAS